MRRRFLKALAAAAALGLGAGAADAASTNWVLGHNSRERLLAASVIFPDGSTHLAAGFQVGLDPTWKTYWRTPGDAGGIPPELDWSGSENLAKAEILYPAPERIADPEGDSIGYEHETLFPIVLTPLDPGKPLKLAVKALVGVCAKICIPEEHTLTLAFDPAAPADPEAAALITRGLASVPVYAGARPDAPKLASISLTKFGGKPALEVKASFAKGTEDVQAFIEATDSSYIPLYGKKSGPGPEDVTFLIDLSKSDDFKPAPGKQVRVTLVGDDASSETMATIQ